MCVWKLEVNLKYHLEETISLDFGTVFLQSLEVSLLTLRPDCFPDSVLGVLTLPLDLLVGMQREQAMNGTTMS